MDKPRCCVCRRPLGAEERRTLGGRDFCAPHHAQAVHATRATLTRSGIVETLAMGAFVVLAHLALGGSDGRVPTSLGWGLALALIPAAIWLFYIYRQDRLEPEPWGAVAGVFLLGGLLGYGAAEPVIALFGVNDWMFRSPFAQMVATVCVIATLQELCKYVAVRYTVYLTEEFDEPIDGVVYATAAGLGLATVHNVAFVVDNESILPLAGATHIAVTALVHVASGTVLGYGIGRARLLEGGQAWLAFWFCAAVFINGGSQILVVELATADAGHHPWAALGIGLAVAAVVLTATHFLTARLQLEALKGDAVVD